MPRKSWAVSSTRASSVSTCRYQSTAGLTLGSPRDATISDTNLSYGLFSASACRIQPWKANVPGLRDVAQGPLVLEDRRPLHREQVGVLGPLDQTIDPLRPLVGVGVLLESDDFGRVGQDAADIERRPAGELGVGAGAARLDAQLAELAEDQGIEWVLRRGLGPTSAGSRESGTVARATPTRPPNRAMIAASPTPSSVSTTPSAIDVARSAAFDWYWASRVTSVDVPSS